MSWDQRQTERTNQPHCPKSSIIGADIAIHDRRVAFKLFSCIQLTSSRHASKAIAPSAAALRSIAVVLAALLDDNDDKEEEFNAGEYDEVEYGDDGEDEDDDDDGKCEDPSAAAAALK